MLWQDRPQSPTRSPPARYLVPFPFPRFKIGNTAKGAVRRSRLNGHEAPFESIIPGIHLNPGIHLQSRQILFWESRDSEIFLRPSSDKSPGHKRPSAAAIRSRYEGAFGCACVRLRAHLGYVRASCLTHPRCSCVFSLGRRARGVYVWRPRSHAFIAVR